MECRREDDTIAFADVQTGMSALLMSGTGCLLGTAAGCPLRTFLLIGIYVSSRLGEPLMSIIELPPG